MGCVAGVGTDGRGRRGRLPRLRLRVSCGIFEIGAAAMGINASSTCTATLIYPSWPSSSPSCMFPALCAHPARCPAIRIRTHFLTAFSAPFTCFLSLHRPYAAPIPPPPTGSHAPATAITHTTTITSLHTLGLGCAWVCFIPKTPNAIWVRWTAHRHCALICPRPPLHRALHCTVLRPSSRFTHILPYPRQPPTAPLHTPIRTPYTRRSASPRLRSPQHHTARGKRCRCGRSTTTVRSDPSSAASAWTRCRYVIIYFSLFSLCSV